MKISILLLCLIYVLNFGYKIKMKQNFQIFLLLTFNKTETEKPTMHFESITIIKMSSNLKQQAPIFLLTLFFYATS